jgi:hypothetical protein
VRVTLKSPPFQIQRYPFSPGLPLGPPTALVRVSQAAPIVAARVKTASPTRATYDVVAPRRAVANAVRTGVVHPKPRPFGLKRV